MTHVCKRSTAGIVRDASGEADAVSPWLGWILAVLAVAAGYVAYGWPGVALAVTVTVFWLLLQFSRTLRVMQRASARPVGSVDSAVMFNAQLRVGMTLLQVLPLARSLGRRVSETPERWAWSDAGGSRVVLDFERARLARWALERPLAKADESQGDPEPPAPQAP
jgi:hypothetical protein